MYDIQALKLDIEFRDDKIAGSGLETGSDTETGGCGDPGLQRKLKLDLDTRVRDQVRGGQHYPDTELWSVQLSVTSDIIHQMN